jgi:hypothetical protein
MLSARIFYGPKNSPGNAAADIAPQTRNLSAEAGGLLGSHYHFNAGYYQNQSQHTPQPHWRQSIRGKFSSDYRSCYRNANQEWYIGRPASASRKISRESSYRIEKNECCRYRHRAFHVCPVKQ